MKALHFPAIVVLSVLLCQAAPLLASPPADTNELVNYVIKVQSKDAKGNTSSLQVTTIDGSFELDTLQKNTVKINNSEIPTTLKLDGTLTKIDAQRGRLKLFLGRTVPYVTGTYSPGSAPGMSSSYSQMQVGLDSAFLVTFGKPLVIQVDDNGEVSVPVTREGN